MECMAVQTITDERVSLTRRSALIPTAISYDAFAQVLAAMDAMRSGIAMRLFQASQQASTISS